MFDIPSIRIGKLFGIPIEINLSWLVIFALVAMGLGGSYFPSLPEAEGAPVWFFFLVGAATALMFFASILLHELSHSLVAKAEGGNVDRITLFIFGGVAQMDEEPRSPFREFLMASAGPGMSLLLAAVLFLGYIVAFGRGAPWFVWAPLEYLSVINFAVAIFNMLPGFPLDGGRVLRSILWGITGDLLKATRWAAQSGQFIGWFLVVVAVLGILQGRVDLIWFGLIGWFIASLAGQAYRQQVVRSRVEGLRVADVMTPDPEYVPGDISLEQLVNEHFLGRRHSRYPVMHEGSIVGLVTLPAVKAVDRSEWPVISTLQVTDRDLSQLMIDDKEDVMKTFARLAGDRPGALLVVRDGRMVGIITRSDLIQLVNDPAQA
jgi:Zn-dependent protease/predicted transcriptional regulator